jgi:acetylornithine deacetylase/succinyl-diaminopimelate desuccinylase family protein
MTHRALEIAQELLRIPSLTGKEEGAVRYLADFLRARGFSVEIQPGANVVARLGRAGGRPSVILCGHHDVVPVGDSANWQVDPFGAEVRDGCLWGRGAADAKGPLATFLAAAEALAREGLPEGSELILVSVREETNDRVQRGIIQVLERGLRADVAFVGEPTQLDLCLGHRGRVDFAVETRGRTAHGSMPQRGVNAVLHMLEVVRELVAMRLPDRAPLGPGTQNIGVIRGGIQTNVVPDYCRIEVDRRITVGETPETVRAEVEDAFARARRRVPDLSASFALLVGYEPSLIPAEDPLVALARAVAAHVLGRPPRTYHMQAHTDQEWLVNLAKIPSLILAPGDMALAHSPNERVPLAELEAGVEIYTRLVRTVLAGELAGPPRGGGARGLRGGGTPQRRR